MLTRTPVPRIVTHVTTIELDRLGIRLPAGYVVRPFRDEDREPLVALRNAELQPMERQDAAEWRHWEALMPDPEMSRLSVEDPSGSVIAMASLSKGGGWQHPDGALNIGVGVAAPARRQGIGSAMLGALEEEARRRGAPRLLSGGNAGLPFGIDWATRRGYHEIGRRIASYLDLAAFDPTQFSDMLARVRGDGIRLVTLEELLAPRDEARKEEFLRALHAAEAPMHEDVPFATPIPHPPYEHFRRLLVESGQTLFALSIVALHGETIAGLTLTGRRQARDGLTYMTGTAREYRGRGVAMAMKVDALSRAKAAGLRALFTVNDESNKAMRGINARLGYQMLPANVQLEKRLA